MNDLMRKMLIFLLVMAMVAAGGWFGRKAYKRVAERRLLAQAHRYMEKKDWRNAGLSLQRALQVNPMSAEASDLLADLFENEGMPAALGWRIRAAQLVPTRLEYRLAWAKTAIKNSDLASAKAALDGLSEKDKGTVEYHKMAGAVDWALNDGVEAERHYVEALRLDPLNQAILMNLATIHLSSTNTAVVLAGRATMEQLATNATLRIPALRHLRAEALSRKALSTAVDYARRIEESPGASMTDRIEYLQLLHASKSPDYSSYLTSLQREARTNSFGAFTLGEWMTKVDNTTNALSWLQSLPTATQTNQPVTVLIADCLAELHEWTPLLTWLEKQDWGDGNYYRIGLESLARFARKDEGEDVAAKGAWQKAIRLSQRRLDRLSKLAQLADAGGLKDERTEVLREITADFPKEKWATGLLESEYYLAGNSRALADLLARSYSADPSDSKLKNDLANVCLLRKSDLSKAYRMAQEAYNAAPNNPYFASTYAYSLLMQDKPAEAVKIISDVKTNYLQIPSVAAYYGVVQARSGHKELALAPLKLAGTAPLLPEEKEIVRVALSQL
jgi:Flp pilus assembly protein TadD